MAAFAWVVFRPREEMYAGQPVSYWMRVLSDLAPGSDPPVVWQDLGPDALVILIKGLELRNGWHEKYEGVYRTAWSATPGWILRRLPRPLRTEDAALNALFILERLGTNARPVYPAMIHVLKTDRSGFLRGVAAECLVEMEPSDALVRPALIASLSDTNLHPIVVTSVSNMLKLTEARSGAGRGAK
jgi:hypothetical protein